MEVQAFALLCALALVTFLSSVNRASQIGWFLAGVLAGVMLLAPGLMLLPWQPLLSSDPGQVSLLLFMLCFARLGNFMRDYLLLPIAGVLAVIWLQALGALGYPSLFALLLVCAASFTALLASLYRLSFRTAFLLDEALLIVMVYALALAIIPGAMSGWDAAVGLKSNAAAEEIAAAKRDLAVLWLAAGFAVLGAVYAKWKRSKALSKKYK